MWETLFSPILIKHKYKCKRRYEIIFKTIINWFKTFKYRKDFNQLKTLRFGDEFWVNIKKYEGRTFEEGHRKRPFVFIDLKNDKICCLYESTKNGRNSISVIRGRKTYFVYFDKMYEIDVRHFMNKKKESLNEKELMELVRNGFTRSPLNQFYSKYQKYASVKVGDIVRHNNSNYYLFALDSVLATIYPIRNTYSEWYVRTSNQKYIAIFSPLQVKKETISLIRPENPKLVQIIKDNKQKAKKKNKSFWHPVTTYK